MAALFRAPPSFIVLSKFYSEVSFNKVNMSSLRLWPRYRGMRAGRLVQERSKLRRLKISTIQQRGVGNGLGKLSWRVSQQAHNPSNCVRLTSTSISTRKGSPSAYVPSLYLSNVLPRLMKSATLPNMQIWIVFV